MKNLKFFAALLFVCSFTVSAIPQRRAVSSAAAPPDTKVIVDTDKDDPLARFAEKGQLPEPGILGLQPSATLASSAAAAILRFDDRSLSNLIGALQKAGFYILDSEQKIPFQPTGKPVGAAFYDFEVAGMLRATQFGAVVTVDKLGKMITNNDPDLLRANLSKLLLNDLRTARRSSDPQTQFIASLIFELGKRTADLSTVAPEQARINLIQASLIERLFLGDLLDAFDTYSEQNGSLIRRRNIFEPGREVRYSPAAWVFQPAAPCEDVADITKVVGIEGKIKKVAGKVFDKESIPSILTGPKEFIKERFKKVAKGIEGTNLVMSYVKVVLANMNIRADITVEDPMPLIRTKATNEYEEQRTVTAKFRIEFKHGDTINCVGKAAKAVTGLEIEVPKDGPLKNVPVKWQPVMEGSGYSKFGGYPVTIVADDKKRQDIYLQVTNDLGENKITLFGKPQDRDLRQEPVVPRAKKAALTVSVATENMDAAEDLPKIFWFGFEGDFGLKAFVEIIPEILAKMALKTYKVSVPVRDWQPCSEDWGGYINYTKRLSKTIVIKSSRTSNGNSTGDGIRRIEKQEDVNVVLNPRTPDDVLNNKDLRPADFRVRGHYSDITEASRDGDPCCGPAEGAWTTKFRDGSETSFFGTFRKRFFIRFIGGARDYSLSFDFDTDPIDAQRHEFFEILDTNCPLEYGEERNEETNGEIALAGTLPDGRYGERFLNPAGDLLQGTKQYQEQDGSTVTWDWALARCSR